MSRVRARRVLPLALVFTVVAMAAWAFWRAPGDGAGVAASGGITAAAISTPSTGFNSITVTWTQQASVQLFPANDSSITYTVERKLGAGSWAAIASGACSGTKAYPVTSCIDVPAGAGSYSYRTVAAYRTWSTPSNAAGPVAYTTDTTAPTNAITLSSITGGAYKSGSTVFYRGAAIGSFKLTNAVADSGPATPGSSQTAALTGTSTGWSHTPSTVSTPTGGPYVSNAFSWSAATSTSPVETVTGSDTAGNTAATALTFTNDSVAPAGGAVDATGLVGGGARYSTTTSLSIAFTTGTDGGAGLATGAQLLRASATLTNGTCGTYGTDAQVGANDPVSPVANTVADQACYRYHYVVPDRVGNTTTYTSGDVKVDTTAPPAPTFAFSAPTNTYGTGSTLYYRSNAASGSFTVTASSPDASGIASYAMPTLPAGWTGVAGGLGVKTYSWAAPSPTAPSGAQNATATNNAGLTSAAAGFTVTSDITAPATGSISYINGFVGSTSVSVSFTKGTDGGSGVDTASGILMRREATVTAGTCGTFGAYGTITGGTNPTSPFADTSVVNGKCYQYEYLVSDNVGNQATYLPSPTTTAAGVDTVAPTITRATVAKTSTSTAGTVRQGGAYYAYAQVTDASSVPSPTANTSSFDTGVTAAAMTTAGGPWTVGGLSYNYRTASLTADTGLTTGTGYSYSISATDLAGNTAGPTAYTATTETYSSVINATAGLVSYWRFNERSVSEDDFTDTAGTVLSSHTGGTGAAWTALASQTSNAVITPAGRVRKGNAAGFSQYYTSGVPASADYTVKADIYVASLVSDGAAGVIGRLDTSTGATYYMARYDVASASWQLIRVTNGSALIISSYAQTLTVGSTYRLGLKMSGTSIVLTVDGVVRVNATDSVITAAGRAGVRLGVTGGSGLSDTTGLHLDTFRVTNAVTTAADSTGTNPGTYVNAPRLYEPGALAGDSDHAVLLDGVASYVTVPDSASLDVTDTVTVEGWIKRSNAVVTSMCLFDKGIGAFQFCLDANNLLLVRNQVSYIVRSTSTTTDTSWHHVVATKSGATSVLYLDGVNVSGTVTNSTLVNTTAALLFGVVNPASGGGYFAGSIDEFAVYNTALSAATVLDHYKAGAGTG